MTFGYFPDRINIPAATGNNMGTCTQAVLNKIAADYPDFDWSPYDQRTNHPDFAFDNSTSQPDGALDYVVVCFRTFKSCGVTLGTNSGVAGGTAVQFPATTTRPRAYRAADGHTQSGGSLGRELFLHEFAHNLYNAPHLLGANNTFGSRLNYTHGWGMMANFYTIDLFLNKKSGDFQAVSGAGNGGCSKSQRILAWSSKKDHSVVKIR